jgi:hypothetical protein
MWIASKVRSGCSAIAAVLGSARFRRAGFGILPKRSFVGVQQINPTLAEELAMGSEITLLQWSKAVDKSSRWQNAIASTLQACGPRNGQSGVALPCG